MWSPTHPGSVCHAGEAVEGGENVAIWSYCALCGRVIPVGEMCYGITMEEHDLDSDTICKDCLAPENFPESLKEDWHGLQGTG